MKSIYYFLLSCLCLFVACSEVSPDSPSSPEYKDIPVPEAVDLGLSVKWASFNIGASVPEGYGDYFAWGETVPKSKYSWQNYKWGNGGWSMLNKYCTRIESGYNDFTDNNTVLDPEDDAAAVNLGGKWRMPTYDELEELRTQCTWEWTTLNGVKGSKVTSNKEGYTNNWIFLPAAGSEFSRAGSYGDYWSSSLDMDNPRCAHFVGSGSSSVRWYSNFRYGWLRIRPVYGDLIHVTGVSLSSEKTVDLGTLITLGKITPSNAHEKGIKWSSSDASVAIVSYDGLVTAIREGTTKITAETVEGGYTATCLLSVVPVPTTTEVPDSPEAVDLGLSVKWASCNVGASKPMEYGDLFAWGETKPKEDYSWSTYKWRKMIDGGGLTKYCTDSGYGYNGFVDNKTVLDPEDDAASVNWGNSWRMPTDADWMELGDNCSWQWMKLNGVWGYKVISNVSGYSDKWIFLPAAGYQGKPILGSLSLHGFYWSSSLHAYSPRDAYGVYYDSGRVNIYGRHYGFSVRPVCD